MLADVESRYRLRELGAGDRELLVRATFENLNWLEPRFSIMEVRQDPHFALYFTPWPREGDSGVVAETPDGTVAGVVWLRHFTADEPAYGFVAEHIPELSIWVHEDNRGTGLGTALLARAIDHARTAGVPAISLSVEGGNPARRLYERTGFSHAGQGFDPGTLLMHL